MYELSLNIMDIVQNSIRAEAKLVTVDVGIDEPGDTLTIAIVDDGRGMSAETLRRATDPFFTTRTTRKVGLGLSYFEMAARMCGGGFSLTSEPGAGTAVRASFGLSHIDRAPLGDMGQTFSLLAGANPDIDFVYTLTVRTLARGGGSFAFDTRKIKELLDGVAIGTPDVIVYMQGYINESQDSITGGIAL